jgi:hypothetical protein
MSIERFAFDLGQLRKDLEGLGNAAPLILARALNRAGTSGKTAMVRAIAQDTGMTSRFVARDIKLDRASRTQPVVVVTVEGQRLPLIAFGARGPEPSRGRGRGVSYISEGGMRKRIPNAFIATVGIGGHRGVFVRSPRAKTLKRRGPKPNRAQLPITELLGPSIPHVFEKKFPIFRAAAEESLLSNLKHEITWEQTKARGPMEFGAITGEGGVTPNF